jgi:hypothetical protein
MIVASAELEVKVLFCPNPRMNSDIAGRSDSRHVDPRPAGSCSRYHRKCRSLRRHGGYCRSRSVVQIVQVVIGSRGSRRDRGRTPSRPVPTSATRRDVDVVVVVGNDAGGVRCQRTGAGGVFLSCARNRHSPGPLHSFDAGHTTRPKSWAVQHKPYAYMHGIEGRRPGTANVVSGSWLMPSDDNEWICT